jgi:hypothetical protein
MLEMRSLKFTIAAANPILAEKLATPSEQNVQQNSNSNRPQLAPLTPKIEKGKAPGFYSNWGFCRANEKVNCLGNFVNRFPGQC